VPIVESPLLMLFPRNWAPARIASAIPTANIAYSIDEMPRSSRLKLRRNLDIALAFLRLQVAGSAAVSGGFSRNSFY